MAVIQGILKKSYILPQRGSLQQEAAALCSLQLRLCISARVSFRQSIFLTIDEYIEET
jgi:hypothetical protein